MNRSSYYIFILTNREVTQIRQTVNHLMKTSTGLTLDTKLLLERLNEI